MKLEKSEILLITELLTTKSNTLIRTVKANSLNSKELISKLGEISIIQEKLYEQFEELREAN